jgi:hypothetical protein
VHGNQLQEWPSLPRRPDSPRTLLWTPGVNRSRKKTTAKIVTPMTIPSQFTTSHRRRTDNLASRCPLCDPVQDRSSRPTSKASRRFASSDIRRQRSPFNCSSWVVQLFCPGVANRPHIVANRHNHRRGRSLAEQDGNFQRLMTVPDRARTGPLSIVLGDSPVRSIAEQSP